MYYCVKCGKQLSDDSKFCPNCGASTSPNLPNPPITPTYQNNYIPQKNNPGKVLKSHYVNADILKPFNIGIILGIIFSLILIFMFISPDIAIENYENKYEELGDVDWLSDRAIKNQAIRIKEKIAFYENLQENSGLILTLLMIEACSIGLCIRLKINYSNVYINICENMIIGNTVYLGGLMCRSFEISYHEIINVYVTNQWTSNLKKNSSLKIKRIAESSPYSLLIRDPYDAKDFIIKQIEKNAVKH